jgi:uroporphyrinogen-III synthase
MTFIYNALCIKQQCQYNGLTTGIKNIYPNVFDIRYFCSDTIPAMVNAMLGQASAFSLAPRRETAATAYPFPYPSPLKKQVSSKARGIEPTFPPQAAILTSRNGVRALHHVMPTCPFPLITVGKQTASLAKEYGFSVTHSAGGDSSQLMALIQQHYAHSAGPLIYFSADITSGDTGGDHSLEQALKTSGYAITRIPLYHMKAVSSFSTELVEALQKKTIAAVTFFSGRTTQHFIQLAKSADIIPLLKPIQAFCFSPNIAKQIPPSYFSSIQTSPTTNNNAMCDLVGKWFRIHHPPSDI